MVMWHGIILYIYAFFDQGPAIYALYTHIYIYNWIKSGTPIIPIHPTLLHLWVSHRIFRFVAGDHVELVHEHC